MIYDYQIFKPPAPNHSYSEPKEEFFLDKERLRLYTSRKILLHSAGGRVGGGSVGTPVSKFTGKQSPSATTATLSFKDG